MPIEILMPALSPTMTEGTLAKWLKAEGDTVKAGDVIAEIETDKATMEVEAVDEGILAKILVAAGTAEVAVNVPIALLLGEDEDASALTAAPKKSHAPGISLTTQPAATSAPAPSPPAAAPGAARPGGERVFASPLARRMALQAGLDLATVSGSGPHGRIVKADIAETLAKGPPAARPPAPAAPAPVAPAAAPAKAAAAGPAPTGPDARTLADKLGLRYRAVPNTSMRKVIARRLTEAKQTIPHFYLTIDCRIDDLLKIRETLNARAPKDGADAYKLSVNDFVVRAVALALKKVPAANASWSEDATLIYDQADVSVAVATPGGLITPIVKHADAKGLAQISNEMKDLAKRAREAKLAPEEFQGGTFTISNLGMFGIREFAAIINPPQGCLLAVGMGEQRPVVTDGALAIATIMTCTLSIDHRVVDGAVGAEFLAIFKKLIEDPLAMLL
ncbi:MAG: pyruvate dehydrogenase complex dihydrolipoamide acetyltransferase [Azospirillum sp.]|nr:pyruvate dehydrogenase complex dihydrolipoamide acetyltransferase [Azospirillum sp.]